MANLRALEDAIYEEAGYEEECSKEHTVRALLRVDHDMPEKTAQQVGPQPHDAAAAAAWCMLLIASAPIH